MSNAGPQFPTQQEMDERNPGSRQNNPHSVIGHTPTDTGNSDPSGRFRGEYMAYHLSPSGGVSHNYPFGSPEEAHGWATTAAVSGSKSHADASGGPHGILSGYEIYRRVADSHTGHRNPWMKFDSGHVNVQPLKPGDNPESRTVLSTRVNGFDGEQFRKNASANWRAQRKLRESKNRQAAAKGK